jgi:hypothetical protein
MNDVEWAKAASPMTGRLGCREFRLEYDADYGIDRRSGWSVVIDGSVVAELMETPEAALKQAMEKVSHWERPRCCAAH